ncbi:hypothetical protein YC2023_088776 [Brassica napus]
MTGSCEQLSWVGSWKKPDDSPSSVRSDFLSLYLYLSLTLSVLTEANPRQSFTSSVAETEKTEEEECGSEDIGATVVCSCETLMNHLTNCGFPSTPRGERVQQSIQNKQLLTTPVPFQSTKSRFKQDSIQEPSISTV